MILVTGANGLVGSHLCRELLTRNIPFKALVRKGSNLELIDDIPAEHLIEGDILDETGLFEILRGVETVIHCAAIISFDPRMKKAMYQVNVNGTRNLVNTSLVHDVNKFIHLSSVAAISKDGKATRTDESVKWPGSQTPTDYGRSKYQAELEVFRGSAEGLEVHCFNPSIILGPGNWEKSSTRLFKYVFDEKKFYTEGFVNYVDIRDLVELLIKAIDKPGTDERYIVSSGSATYKEFFEIIARELSKKPPHIKVNRMVVNLTVLFAKVYSFVTGNSPLITRETARNSMRKVTYDNSKVKNEFGFSFRNLDESVRWVSRELLDSGYSLK